MSVRNSGLGSRLSAALRRIKHTGSPPAPFPKLRVVSLAWFSSCLTSDSGERGALGGNPRAHVPQRVLFPCIVSVYAVAERTTWKAGPFLGDTNQGRDCCSFREQAYLHLYGKILSKGKNNPQQNPSLLFLCIPCTKYKPHHTQRRLIRTTFKSTFVLILKQLEATLEMTCPILLTIKRTYWALWGSPCTIQFTVCSAQ